MSSVHIIFLKSGEYLSKASYESQRFLVCSSIRTSLIIDNNFNNIFRWQKLLSAKVMKSYASRSLCSKISMKTSSVDFAEVRNLFLIRLEIVYKPKECGNPDCGYLFCATCIDEFKKDGITICPKCKDGAGAYTNLSKVI